MAFQWGTVLHCRLDRIKFLKAIDAEELVPLSIVFSADTAKFATEFREFGEFQRRLHAKRRQQAETVDETSISSSTTSVVQAPMELSSIGIDQGD